MVTTTFDVFLAYHPAELPAAEDLARRLQRERLEPWLDYWRMRGGDPIQETIENALKNSASCAVLFGPNGTGEWQTEQLRVAIARRVEEGSGFRVIPVLLPGATRGPRSGLPDFVGDAPLFFGRQARTGWLLDKLRSYLGPESRSRFLAILGPSGSGKSSLARAGLLAALGELPVSRTWPQLIIRPGENALENLAVELSGRLAPDDPTALLRLSDGLRNDTRTLHASARLLLGGEPGSYLVLLVDQFEELFTLQADQHRIAADQRRITLLRRSVLVGSILLVLALAAGGFAMYQANEATKAQAVSEQQARIATSRGLSQASLAQLSTGDTSLAGLLAVVAVRSAATYEADTALRAWLSTPGRYRATLQGHQDQVWSTAFSPDGKRIVTASWDYTAKVWNAESGQVLATLRGHQDRVYHAAFSPDGKRIVTASWDYTAKVWTQQQQSANTPALYAPVVACVNAWES